MSVFVAAEELNDRIQSGKKQTVIAALWEQKEDRGWAKFQSEHVPSALFCDPASHLAGMPGRAEGRNPLPHIDVVRKAVKSWGIEAGRPTYVYDQGTGLFAARAWWVLRWAGIQDVFIVDGGFASWDDKQLPTVAGPGQVVVPREVQLKPGCLPTASMEEVRDFAGLLIDARSQRRFQGRREALDLRAGHIPNAVNLPVAELFHQEDDHVLVRSADEILQRAAEAGITESTDPAQAITYSGSGNHSALLLAALEHAGLPTLTHYIGGWSQWAANRENPVAADV